MVAAGEISFCMGFFFLVDEVLRSHACLPCMPVTVEELEEKARELSLEDREILVHRLMNTLRQVDPEIESAWIAEAKLRWQRVQSGAANLIDGPDALKQARAVLDEAL